MCKFKIIRLTILALFLTACQTTSQPATDAPTAQLLRIGLGQDTTWIAPSLDTCQKEIPGVRLSVQETPARELNSSREDILIITGSVELESVSAAQIGEVEAVFIVHPSNAIQSLDDDTLVKIFAGQLRQWSELDPSLPAEHIQVWLPVSGGLREVVNQIFFTEQSPSPYANLAPDPLAVLAAVSTDKSAIGILPIAYQDPSVRGIQTPIKFILPLLAVTKAEPVGITREFLLCLQSSIQ